MATDDERRARWRVGPVAFGALAAAIGVLWAIWSVPLVMTNDGPEAVLTAHMEAHYDDPGSLYARQFSVGFGLSGRGYSVLYRPLAAILPWPSSYRATQVIIVVALALAVGWLSRALSKDARCASLLGFAIAFSWPFYMGFYAFTISMTVGLMILAFVVSKSAGLTLLEKAAVTTALIVQLFMHGFAVFITLALIALVVLTRAVMQRTSRPPAEWRRATLGELAWLFVSALPSLAVLMIMRSAQSQMATLAGSGKTEWAKPSDWARILPRLAVPGSTPLGTVVLVLAVVAVARTALRLRRRPEERRPGVVAVLVGATGLLGAGILLPLNIPGWQFFSPRFFTTGLALALSLLGTETLVSRRVRLGFDVGVVALVGAVVLSARALHHHLATACEDALAGLEHRIERSYFQLPVTFDTTCGLSTDETRLDVPYSKPLLHFYALFPVIHGGSVPYGFFGPAAVHAFVPRPVALVPVPNYERYWGLSKDDPRLGHPKARATLFNELAVFGTQYENIIFFGANASDRALLLDRGYAVDYQHGSFVNAHYVPCAVELVSNVLPGDPPVLVSGGLREDELFPSKITPLEGDVHAIRASLKMLCGDVWVHVQWQNSELRCANADAKGRIAFHADHGATTRVVCERR